MRKKQVLIGRYVDFEDPDALIDLLVVKEDGTSQEEETNKLPKGFDESTYQRSLAKIRISPSLPDLAI